MVLKQIHTLRGILYTNITLTDNENTDILNLLGFIYLRFTSIGYIATLIRSTYMLSTPEIYVNLAKQSITFLDTEENTFGTDYFSKLVYIYNSELVRPYTHNYELSDLYKNESVNPCYDLFVETMNLSNTKPPNTKPENIKPENINMVLSKNDSNMIPQKLLNNTRMLTRSRAKKLKNLK